ncbi:ecdysteroid kinase domain-containing protein [Sarocladium implicatum]|nr:ecdysteroid kinase domain-containing protein [Sarocladium implicatum]
MANSPEGIAKILLARHDLHLTSIRTLQSLWAGYGSICAVTARASSDDAASTVSRRLYGPSLTASKKEDIPLILKFISPPKGRGGDEGHLRKILSYEVEQHFYANLAPRLSQDVRVATCLASTERDDHGLEGFVAMLLADLRLEFPIAGGKRDVLQPQQVHSAIDWLGSFHKASKGWRTEGDLESFILPPLEEAKRRGSGKAGDKVWLNGGYTYLATRQKEYSNLKTDSSSEWSSALCETQPSLGCSVAEAVAKVLTPRGRPTESFIHGDVKSENLFTTTEGDAVAFFDFQYIGLGLGVCDLAKLFTCSVPMTMLGDDADEAIQASAEEDDLLQRYRRALCVNSSEESYNEQEFKRHWECALVDWCRFQASWGFWGNTEWLEGRVRWILRDEAWQKWLEEELKTIKS